LGWQNICDRRVGIEQKKKKGKRSDLEKHFDAGSKFGIARGRGNRKTRKKEAGVELNRQDSKGPFVVGGVRREL